tara:strand:- start:14395 stop:16281 length:1887 start_codon:yes stop_codon:yes gene_type:complete
MATINEKISKDIKYIGKDFPTIRKNLVEFAKTYYPTTFNDFNEASPGMMFLETTAYVGDLLSFYLDKQFKEALLPYATERKNINALAQSLGYNPKQAIAAQVEVDIFQTIPAVGTGESNKPDFRYALAVKGGMKVKGSKGATFRRNLPIDFSISGSADDTEVSIFSTDDTTGEPTYYLLRKRKSFEAGTSLTETFTVREAQAFFQVALARTNIIEIIKVTDSEGNEWSEVPFLAQDLVFKQIENSQYVDPELTEYNSETPYLLRLKKTSRRFISRIREDGKRILEFGSGTSTKPDEEIIPNPINVGSTLPSATPQRRTFIDPSNFMYTKAYGQAPSNTTLTVEYTIGNGVSDNVKTGDITDISFVDYMSSGQGLDATLFNNTKASIAATNPTPAQGGRGTETLEEIRDNALAFFNAQGRVVSKDDYMIRTLTMPSQYGSIAKVYVTQDEKLNTSPGSSRIRNPFAVNLYVLSYDANKNLVTTNNATKSNIKNYLSPYRLLTDSVTIKNAFIINIAIDFEIITLPGFNSNDVLLKSIETIKRFFLVDRMQINQPIIFADIYTELASQMGVQSITKLQVYNQWDDQEGYSGNIYDIKQATRDGVIYPSLDPSIFEVRYPDSDIKGRVVSI